MYIAGGIELKLCFVDIEAHYPAQQMMTVNKDKPFMQEVRKRDQENSDAEPLRLTLQFPSHQRFL